MPKVVGGAVAELEKMARVSEMFDDGPAETGRKPSKDSR